MGGTYDESVRGLGDEHRLLQIPGGPGFRRSRASSRAGKGLRHVKLPLGKPRPEKQIIVLIRKAVAIDRDG